MEKLVDIVLKVVGDADKTLKKVTAELSRMTKGMATAAAGASKMTSATDKAARKTKDLGDKSKKAGGDIAKMDSQFAAMAGSLARAAAIIASVGFPVVKAAQFQRAMSEVQSLFGATAKEMQAVTQLARDMGAQTEFSAVQAAEGLRLLAMAGLSTQEAMAALPHTLNLAQASGASLGEAADILTNILTGMGMSVTELTRVNDVLVNTFTSTNSTLQELGYGMSYAAPVAAGLGANFEDLAAAMGLLHSAGIKGSTAGTALRGTMIRLVSPTKEAAKGIAAISERLGEGGLKLRDAEGNWIGFTELVRQLEKAGATTSEVIDILGQRAGPGLAALLGQGSAALQEMTRSNEMASGRAAEVAKIMHENVVGSVKAFQSVAVDLAIELGNKMLPAVDAVIKMLTTLTRVARDLAQEFPTLAQAFTLLTGAIAATAAALLTLNAASLLFTGTGFKMGAAVKVLAAAFPRLAAGVALLGKGIKAVAAFATSATGILIGLVALFGALAFSEKFRAWVSDIEIFGVKVGELLAGVFALMVAEIERYIVAAFKLFRQIADLPKMTFAKVLEYIGEWGLKLVNMVGKIPGLGALLGWDEDTAAIKGYFEDLIGKGAELADQTRKNSDAAVEAFSRQFSNGRMVLDQINGEIAVRADLKKKQDEYNAVKARELYFDQEIADRVKEINQSREIGLSTLEANAKKAENAWSTQTEIMRSFVETGQGLMEDLGDAIDKNITQVWEDATSDNTVVEGYRKQLETLTRETELYGKNTVLEMAQIGQDMGKAQSDAILAAAAKTDTLYDQQIENYKKFTEAQTNLAGYEGQARIQKEKEIAQDVSQFAATVYEKKKTFYEKATAALKTELDKSRAAEKDTANKIIEINEQIRLSKLSAEEKIRELRRKGMTEEEVFADKQLQYQEYLAKAQENVGKDYEKAIEYAQKAQQVAGELYKTTADGSADVSEAIAGVQQAQQVAEEAAAAEKSILEKSLQAHRNNTQTMEDSFARLKANLADTKAALADKLEAKVTVDRTQFDTLIQQMREQSGFVLKAQIGVEEAQAQLVAYKKQTQDLINQDPLIMQIRAQADEELTTMLTELTGARELLTQEVVMKITSGEGLDATTVKLAELAGITAKIDEETHTVKIMMGDQMLATAQAMDSVVLAAKQLETPRTVVVEEKVSTDKLEALPQKLDALPSEEAPKVVPVTADTQEAEDSIMDLIDTMDMADDIEVSASVSGVDEAVSQIDALKSSIKELPPETHVRVVKTIVTRQVNEGGEEVKAQTGLRIPGFGGGDKIPALLEPGEWIIRKEAVKKYGDVFMARLNAGLLPGFRFGGRIASAIAGALPRFATGGKMDYAAWIKLIEEINGIGDRLSLLLGGDARTGRDLYGPTGRAEPAISVIASLLNAMDKTPLSGVSTDWKSDFREKTEAVLGRYQAAGGTDAYRQARADYFAQVRRSSPEAARMTDAEIEYQALLGRTFAGAEGFAETYEKLRESYSQWATDASAAMREKLAGMFGSDNISPEAIAGARKAAREQTDTQTADVGIKIRKFAKGGLVEALSGGLGRAVGLPAQLLDAVGAWGGMPPLSSRFGPVPAFADGGAVDTGSVIKHQVDFNLAGQTVGPFEAKPQVIDDLLNALDLARGRH